MNFEKLYSTQGEEDTSESGARGQYVWLKVSEYYPNTHNFLRPTPSDFKILTPDFKILLPS